ncbi:hypothetical protein [Phenylobacterium hankyongense]|uniref:hypothetical protein n=1 Tax=Phenylobacterium hankyongense TaxID=1813876 RepID=UPI001403B7FC|nr:hypothetical protein [Phenylobacterium hankyongense]
MRKDRFEELAQAYGGDIARWPLEVRDAAALLVAEEPTFTQAVLADAGRLDVALEGWARAPASAALVDRIVAGRPVARRRPVWRGWLAPAGLGAALAAACAAGVIVGAQVSPTPTPTDSGDTVASVSADLDISGLSEEV